MVGVLILIVGIAAFMVDIGRMQLVRSQLQTAVDAGSIVNRNALRVLATQANEPYIFGGIFGNSSFAIPGQSIAVSGHVKLDIMMVLDLSGSMGSQGRIEALRAAAPIFLDVIEERAREDEISVMGYGAVIGSYFPASEGHSGTLYTSRCIQPPRIRRQDGLEYLNRR